MTADLKYVEPAIPALLDSVATGKIYALRAPDGDPGPFVIFQRTDTNQLAKKIVNPVPGEAGQVQCLMNIDAYAPGFYDAKNMGAAIEKILDGYKGTVYYGSNSPQDFVIILGCAKQNDVDNLDQTDDPLLFRSDNTYLITYQQ